ncbi:unnamed protein product, partial [Mesorhabditis belari]|uniref:Ubiquinol-cytochrome c chaperone domain-containing protein n=1 Tax=Mesorhabditis belari TaxID=2138241 RepID=A0AAF3ESM0_9BILA
MYASRSTANWVQFWRSRTNLLSRTLGQRRVLSNEAKRVQTLDEYLEKQTSTSSSVLPKSIDLTLTRIKNKLSPPMPVDPNLKLLLDQAATQLYYNCANHFDYDKLCSSFGLPDYFSTWFKLTLMHIWMVLLRTQVSMDAAAYMRLQSGLLASLWLDVEKRLEIISEELGKSMKRSSDLTVMHGLHIQTFLEYDEGFLSSDAQLAAAVWRCLYLSREVDPNNVLKSILYMRSTVAWLDTLDLQEILVDGLNQWNQIKPKTSFL